MAFHSTPCGEAVAGAEALGEGHDDRLEGVAMRSERRLGCGEAFCFECDNEEVLPVDALRGERAVEGMGNFVLPQEVDGPVVEGLPNGEVHLRGLLRAMLCLK